MNNTAGQGGDALYGGIVGLYSYIKGDWKITIPCSSLFEKVSNIAPNTSSQVASDPIRVCHCKYSFPECDMARIRVDPIFPGQTISVSAIVVGYEQGTVAGSVFAAFQPLHSKVPQLPAGEDTKRATQVHCNELKYTIFSTNKTEVLVLSTISQAESLLVDETTGPISFSEFPLYMGHCWSDNRLSQIQHQDC